jgi:hypothetical protein
MAAERLGEGVPVVPVAPVGLPAPLFVSASVSMNCAPAPLVPVAPAVPGAPVVGEPAVPVDALPDAGFRQPWTVTAPAAALGCGEGGGCEGLGV